jgi:hypothetical protein
MTDYRRDLDEWLEPDPDEGEAEVMDQLAADSCLRVLATLDRDEAEVKGLAQDEHVRVEEWARDRLAGIDSRRKWLMHRLEGFARASGSLTITLPWGVLKLRKRQQTVALLPSADRDALAAIAPDLWDRPDPVQPPPALKVRKAMSELRPGNLILAREPKSTDPPDREWHEAIYKGEVLPGIAVLVPRQARGFSVEVRGDQP